MSDTAAASKLADPRYFALHVQAAMAIRQVGQLDWYDSDFLRRLEVAKRFLGNVRPDAVARFEEGFAQLKPASDFRPVLLDDLFDHATRQAILDVARRAQPEQDEYQHFENSEFGRKVVWDNAFFRELQEQVRPMLSEIVGMPLQSTYNFLSIYGGSGTCDPHLDHPHSMFTFDYCIEQSEEWPIHFSRVSEWPTPATMGQFGPAKIKDDPSLDFAAYNMRPNQALLFCGSSQWHYRNPITPGGFCKLLFFHYVPSGCEGLVDPARWASHMGIPELEALCDLFQQNCVDGLMPSGR